ncbi:probable leucine-rich repeat receptor-like protein kinase [Tanacetum coccineum]
MSGTISPYLSNLTFLQLLDLSSLKDLKGPIPPEFGKLSRLTRLSLDGNNLSGTLPYVIFRSLKSLREINLNGNKFFGQIPSSIGHMISVTLLSFTENNLSGIIPETIGSSLKIIDCIQKLVFDNNKLSGELPASIGHLITLSGIFLNNNQFTGSIPTSFGNLSNLQSLILFTNNLTGRIPSQLATLGDLPPLIGNMTNLILLNLSNNGFSNAIRSEFKNLSLLTDLDLHSNNFTGLFYMEKKFRYLEYWWDERMSRYRRHGMMLFKIENSSLKRPVRGGVEQQEFSELCSILNSVMLSQASDHWYCSLSSSGISVRKRSGVRPLNDMASSLLIPSHKEVLHRTFPVIVKKLMKALSNVIGGSFLDFGNAL